MADNHANRFLSAEWRNLLMLNFEIHPNILRTYLPRGCELDAWQGRHFVSVVGFRFLNTRLFGMPIPFHRDFDEINLRFYVRRMCDKQWRRGVVFIKEIVPRWMVSCVARAVYNERYVTHRMRSDVVLPGADSDGSVRYEWKQQGRWNRIAAVTAGAPTLVGPEAEANFITEHYWGYTVQRDGGTAEYEVEHPPWRVWQASKPEFVCDVQSTYGPEFHEVLAAKPSSVFVAEGSAVIVRKGRRID
jgi:uncharacterized protein YqjF (DUF2071 family)